METAVAVKKNANADRGLSCAASAPATPSGTESTETIWAMHGRTPATPCPVMMACVYSLDPKPLAKVMAPFCDRAVAALVRKTVRMRKAK